MKLSFLPVCRSYAFQNILIFEIKLKFYKNKKTGYFDLIHYLSSALNEWIRKCMPSKHTLCNLQHYWPWKLKTVVWRLLHKFFVVALLLFIICFLPRSAAPVITKTSALSNQIFEINNWANEETMQQNPTFVPSIIVHFAFHPFYCPVFILLLFYVCMLLGFLRQGSFAFGCFRRL